jgi:hypothetical protein
MSPKCWIRWYRSKSSAYRSSGRVTGSSCRATSVRIIVDDQTSGFSMQVSHATSAGVVVGA